MYSYAVIFEGSHETHKGFTLFPTKLQAEQYLSETMRYMFVNGPPGETFIGYLCEIKQAIIQAG